MSNTKKLLNHKDGLKLTPLQRSALIGLMLGDGHLETQNEGKTYALRIEQSVKHEPYVTHLYELFKDWVTTPPHYKFKEKGKNIAFRTVAHSSLRFYAQLFYEGKKKVVPKNPHKYFDDIALAYWYMDDGALKGKNRSGKRLHTEGFTQAEVNCLCEELNLYGIECTVQKQNKKKPDGSIKTYYILYITAKGDKVLTEKIREYVLPCFLYKLD
jgi:hypothetical protein